MPAKTKKPNRGARTTRTPAKKKSASARFQPRSFFNNKMWLAVMAIAVVGAFAIFRANAASTNFEAESASTKSRVTVKPDPNASGGNFVEFASTTTTTSGSVPQRFPGDPNPLVSGKAYWGAEKFPAQDFKARFEDPTGKPLSLTRRFYSSWDKRSLLASEAKSDIAAKRLPMVSIKPGSWATMASGSRNSEIDGLMRDLQGAGGPVWLIVHHEADGGGGCGPGPKCEDDPAGVEAWKKMQVQFRQSITRTGTKNVALMAAMTYGWANDPFQPKDNWWVDNTFDAWHLDFYYYSIESQKMADKGEWKKFIEWAKGKNIPVGTAELGIRSGGKEGIGYWLGEKETSNFSCSNLVPRGISASLDQTAGMRLREFWEDSFRTGARKDVIAHAYFDTCANSGTSPYTMGGEQLRVFKDILKNDPKVMRITELGSSVGTGDYGTVSQSVSVPTAGEYKVWVRMKAADASNNTVRLQAGSNPVVTLGGSNVSPTNWTWVSTNASLSGNQMIALTGIQKSVKVDRVIVTNENCTLPTGTGENCLTTTTPPPSPEPEPSGDLNIGIVTPSAGATVSAPTKVTVGGLDIAKVDEVRFRLNDQWQYTDSDPAFEWTVTLPQGEHTITIRAQKIGDPGTVYTEKSIKVTSTIGSAPIPAPKDITAPSKPTNLRASLTFDATKFRYTMPLTWTASTDDSGEAPSYNISRNGTPLGSSPKPSFTDTTQLNAGSVYTYSVTAKDRVGNPSNPASLTVKVDCFLIFCNVSTP